MGLKTTNITIVFDLDDTLYKEIDFLKSAYQEIAIKVSEMAHLNPKKVQKEMLSNYTKGANVFEQLISAYDLKVDVHYFLTIYRNHSPTISLTDGNREVLNTLKAKGYNLCLLTDGRSIQQRSKLKALGIEDFFTSIIISEEFGSEKPSIANYTCFVKNEDEISYIYIGDNTKKDFVSANLLQWTTICLLDNGQNIHQQNFN